MSWNNLKFFAIAVLLCLNVIFAVCVIHQYNTENYYSTEEIDSVSEILAKSKIYVSKNIMRAKKVTVPVYKRSFSQDALFEIAGEICRGFTLSQSDEIITAESGSEKWTFFYDYSFSYSRDDCPAPSVLLESSVLTELITTTDYETTFNRLAGEFLGIKRINQNAANSGARKTSVMLYRLFSSEQDGIYIAMFRQLIDGKATSNTFYLAYDGEKIISGEGTFAFLLPDTSQTADNTDLINLLFNEKRNLDAKTPGGDYKVQLISSVVYEYDVYYDTDGVCYYVPVCNLIYSDGTMHTYNLVDGKER